MTEPATDPDADLLLRMVQRDVATARVLSYLLTAHGDGLPFPWGSSEVERATGLRPSLILAALANLVSLKLLRLSRGKTARLEVTRIQGHIAHPELPGPSPRFSTEVHPAYREERHRPTGTEGRSLLAQHRADDLLADIFNDHLDAVERDLLDIEEVDNTGGPDHDDTD